MTYVLKFYIFNIMTYLLKYMTYLLKFYIFNNNLQKQKNIFFFFNLQKI